MAKKAEAIQGLNAALAFAKVAIKDEGEPYQTHVIMWDKVLYSYDGTIATGHPIEEDIQACPQGTALRAALVRCVDAVSLGVSEGALALRSGRFRVSIPCLPIAMLRPFQPDALTMPLDDTIKLGFAALDPLTKEGAPLVLESALKFAPGSMTASNRVSILEFWHGFNLPSVMLLPKVAVKAVLACQHKLVGYGCSKTSATFWFENKAWIKTQVFVDDYPNTSAILDKACSALPLADDFMKGINSVVPFGNESTHITYGPNGLAALQETGLSASYDIPGIEKTVKMSGYQWQLIGKHVESVDWLSHSNAVFVFGKNMRGAISKLGV